MFETVRNISTSHENEIGLLTYIGLVAGFAVFMMTVILTAEHFRKKSKQFPHQLHKLSKPEEESEMQSWLRVHRGFYDR